VRELGTIDGPWPAPPRGGRRARAGTAPDEAGGPSRGTNQAGVKLYNERLVLSLIRAHGSLSKVEIARITGLSAQTSSVIMKQLESDGLLRRQAPLRGKVGQPSVPFALDPEGSFAIGLKVGRRSADLVLMDFVGAPRRLVRSAYAYPEPGRLAAFVEAGLAEITAALAPAQRARICGLGIAAPFEMWSWEAEVGAPAAVIEAWRHADIAATVRALVPWPVHFCKDATAACAAELAFGRHGRLANYLYVFVATLVGGGVVLDGSLYPGRAGYAGSIGSVLVAAPACEPPGVQRLIRCASLSTLEAMLRRAGLDPAVLGGAGDWGDLGAPLEQWIEQASDGLSMAIGSAVAVIDFEAVVIDGACPAPVRARLVERTRDKVERTAPQGVAPVEVVEGSIGRDARVLGAASLPLLAGFARDRDLLFRAGA